MKRVAYEEMVAQFTRVLEKHGFTPADAKDAAVIFAQNSLSGVYSHGLNRFPRVVSYLEKGEIDPLARAECISRMGSMERWDGHRGFGPLNAQRAMERACALAKENGVGIVALGNNNHWMRGGTYGWLAAEKGCIGICWSNTAPNMPAWGPYPVAATRTASSRQTPPPSKRAAAHCPSATGRAAASPSCWI